MVQPESLRLRDLVVSLPWIQLRDRLIVVARDDVGYSRGIGWAVGARRGQIPEELLEAPGGDDVQEADWHVRRVRERVHGSRRGEREGTGLELERLVAPAPGQRARERVEE